MTETTGVCAECGVNTAMTLSDTHSMGCSRYRGNAEEERAALKEIEDLPGAISVDSMLMETVRVRSKKLIETSWKHALEKVGPVVTTTPETELVREVVTELAIAATWVIAAQVFAEQDLIDVDALLRLMEEITDLKNGKV